MSATNTRQPPDVAEPESALEEARGYLWRAAWILEEHTKAVEDEESFAYWDNVTCHTDRLAERIAIATGKPPSHGPKHLPRSLR